MLDVQFTAGNWFEGLPAGQSKTLQSLLDSGSTEEQIAESWLSTAGATSTAGFGTIGVIQSFYNNVKSEFIAFICGDPRYDKERTQAIQTWNNQGKVGLVSMTSAVIASTVGLAAAAVVPVIALLFSLVGRVGVNAFCASCKDGASTEVNSPV